MIQKLLEEKRKIEVNFLEGKPCDFSNLRKEAKELNHYVNNSLKVDENDEKFFESIVELEKKFRP